MRSGIMQGPMTPYRTDANCEYTVIMSWKQRQTELNQMARIRMPDHGHVTLDCGITSMEVVGQACSDRSSVVHLSFSAAEADYSGDFPDGQAKYQDDWE